MDDQGQKLFRKLVHPPGTIGIPCGVHTGYSSFTSCLANLERPEGTKVTMVAGPSVVRNHNEFLREREGEWVWLMGDDHTFLPDTLLRLLDHNVDVVVPLVFRRLPPFRMVLYKGEAGTSVDEDGEENTRYEQFQTYEIPKHGLFEVYAAGTAGMLVRENVWRAIDPPWFTSTGTIMNEDLEFCRKVREAGFKIWADPDAWLGHVVTAILQPAMSDGGNWGALFTFGDSDQLFIESQKPKSGVLLPEDVGSDILVPTLTDRR